MTYVLESDREFQRLERQSTFPKYDFTRELALSGLAIPSDGAILDAGCGSGTVSRHLAERAPNATIVGCDFSADRLALAREAGSAWGNLRFDVGDISRLTYPDKGFDLVLSRYVLQHVEPAKRAPAVSEFHRVLRPGGRIGLIDFDGTLYNLYPQPPFLARALARLEAEFPVDLRIGRKLPSMLSAAGFIDVSWRIDLIECTGEALEQELEMTAERLTSALEPLSRFFGGRAEAERFRDEYLKAMVVPGAVLFYNKFIATGTRSPVE